MATFMRGKLRWGDQLDEDEVLPPPQISTNGNTKTVTEYYKNERGETMKKTTKSKVVNVEKKVYEVAKERRNWKPFGAAAKETPQDSVTVQAVEDIPFDRVRQLKATQQEKKQANMDLHAAMREGMDKQAISGSIKDMLYKKRMERELMRAKGLLKEAEKPPGEEDGPPRPASTLPPPGSKPGSYVPPSLRNRGAGERMDDGGRERRRDENSLRVTNLSDDVTEADLLELFRPFGPVSRVFVAVDRATGENRGFAFVNYVYRDDAEKAIRALEGYGYDNLILHVEWAAPRAER